MGALTVDVMQWTMMAGEAGVDGEGARSAAGRAGEAARFRRSAASHHRRVEEEGGETEAEQVAVTAGLGVAGVGGEARRQWSSARLGLGEPRERKRREQRGK